MIKNRKAINIKSRSNYRLQRLALIQISQPLIKHHKTSKETI